MFQSQLNKMSFIFPNVFLVEAAGKTLLTMEFGFNYLPFLDKITMVLFFSSSLQTVKAVVLETCTRGRFPW